METATAANHNTTQVHSHPKTGGLEWLSSCEALEMCASRLAGEFVFFFLRPLSLTSAFFGFGVNVSRLRPRPRGLLEGLASYSVSPDHSSAFLIRLPLLVRNQPSSSFLSGCPESNQLEPLIKVKQDAVCGSIFHSCVSDLFVCVHCDRVCVSLCECHDSGGMGPPDGVQERVPSLPPAGRKPTR